jgi:putative ABC transport system permease protein
MIRWCVWLLERYVSPEIADHIVGDLVEQQHRGTLWVCRETIAALWYLRARPPQRDAFVHSLLADVRVSARLLRRSPTFAIVSILTLSLAIGATTAIFSVIDPVLLQSLPYPHADRLAIVWDRHGDGSRDDIGFATYRDLVAQSHALERAAVVGSWNVTVTGHGEPERVSGDRVSWTYFTTLGARPALGRDFRPDEDIPGHNQVVILSDGLWRRRFGADSSIIGQAVSIDGDPMTVVGVMPAAFANVVSSNAEIWRALGYAVTDPWACRTCHSLRMIARIRSNTSLGAAATEVDQIMARLAKEYPTEYASTGGMLTSLQDEVTASIRPALYALTGAVLLVLVIAAANVVNLQLARGLKRDEEFAVRLALGAGHGRLVRQLLTEGLLLATLGGVGALLIAVVGIPILVAHLPPDVPRLDAIHLDLRAFGVTGAAVVALAVIIGIAPLRRGRSTDLGITLRSSRRLASPGHHGTRAALVVGEIALSMMLLISAGLVARSLTRLLAVNLGLDPTHLLTLEFAAVGPQYQDDAAVYRRHNRVRAAVLAIPGVTSVAVSNQIPLGGNVDMYGVVDPANPAANAALVPNGDRYVVSPDYFSTVRIPILQGRAFAAAEAADTVNDVALVSAALAERLWPGVDPIGKQIQLGGATQPKRTVIGVAGNVHHHGLDAAVTFQWYVPDGQWAGADDFDRLVVRTAGDPAALAATVRQVVTAVDPTQPVLNVATMDHIVAVSTAQRRLALAVFGAFAVTALLLVVAGLYGVLAASVAERTKELAIRSALGATPQDIVRLVIGQGGRFTTAGIALGLAGTFALTRFLRSLLFGIGPMDPATLIGVAVLLTSVTLAACLVPASRAARLNPSGILRGD